MASRAERIIPIHVEQPAGRRERRIPVRRIDTAEHSSPPQQSEMRPVQPLTVLETAATSPTVFATRRTRQEDVEMAVKEKEPPPPASSASMSPTTPTATGVEQNGDEPMASSSGGSSIDNDDPMVRECLERLEIVDKYDKGTEGQEVDPWENPDFEVYKVTDRYGFMHQGEGTPLAPQERERVKKELNRELKWLRMRNAWDNRPEQLPTKLKQRVWKGIPDKLRAEIWTRVLNIGPVKVKVPGVYEQLKIRARLISRDLKQIDMDINRTYRDHLFFRKRYDIKQKSLFHVLAAYSMYNTEVGYCQGMSQICALLLMYMDEEEAFWCLHALLCDEKHAMHGFFVPGFPKLVRFQEHFDRLLAKYFSRLKKHMDKMSIPQIYTTKWWFGCFLDRVPFTLALRIWDVFMFEGDTILIAMAYTIFKMHYKTLRKVDFENFMAYVQDSLAEDFGYSDDEVMQSLFESLRKLRGDRTHLPPAAKRRHDSIIHDSEMPTKPLGLVLKRPVHEIRAEVEELASRKSVSRAGSMIQHRSQGSSPSKTAGAIKLPLILSPSTPSATPPRRQRSFYDNVDEENRTAEQPAADYELKEERRTVQRFRSPTGGLAYESSASRVVTRVETRTTTTNTTTTPLPRISRGSDHVTYVTGVNEDVDEPLAHVSQADAARWAASSAKQTVV